MKVFTHYPVQLEEMTAVTTEHGRHYTTPEGKRYPSVTTVLGAHTRDGINEWRDAVGHAVADKIKNQAAVRGTKFHEFAEKYLNNENPSLKDLPILEQDLFSHARRYLDRIDNIRAQEVPLYSDFLRIAGRTDVIGEFDGKRSVIDFKTSRQEKKKEYIGHYFMQCAAYAIAWEERTGIPITNLVLIIACEDGFTQVEQSKRDSWVKDLLQYRDLYEAEHK